MFLETLCERLRLARSVNQTSTSFVAKVDTLTEPTIDINTATGQSVIKQRGPGVAVQNFARLTPFGVGSDTNTFSMRIYSWDVLQIDRAASARQFIPTLLAEFLCTLTSGETGVAGGLIDTTNLYCDTIALTYPTTQPSSIEICSNAANLKAHIVLDMKAAEMFELTFSTGSSATSCNCLIKQY